MCRRIFSSSISEILRSGGSTCPATGVMHETEGLSLEPGEKGIADTLRRVAQQNGLDWTKLLVGRNIAPKLATNERAVGRSGSGMERGPRGT